MQSGSNEEGSKRPRESDNSKSCPLLELLVPSEDLALFLARSIAAYAGIPSFVQFSSASVTFTKLFKTKQMMELIRADAGAPVELETLEHVAFWQAVQSLDCFRNENRVGFDYASTEVTNHTLSNSTARVQAARKLRKQFPNLRIVLEAHCGTLGPHHIARHFSHARGASVALQLLEEQATSVSSGMQEDEDAEDNDGRMILNAVFEQNDPFYHYYEASSSASASEDDTSMSDADADASEMSSDDSGQIEYIALGSDDENSSLDQEEPVDPRENENNEQEERGGEAEDSSSSMNVSHDPQDTNRTQKDQTITINAWGRRISDRIVQIMNNRNPEQQADDKFATLARQGKGWVEIYFHLGGQEFPIRARPTQYYEAENDGLPVLEPFDSFVVS